MQEAPESPGQRLKNAALIATVVVVVILGAVVGVGRWLTCDWTIIWAAVSGIGAFVALAALFTAAIYAREQYHESLRASQRETEHAREQLALERENAAAAAKSSAEQLHEAKQANAAAQNFERVRLTREIIVEHTAITLRVREIFNVSWAVTKAQIDADKAAGRSDWFKLYDATYLAIYDCSALYAAGVLDKDIFLRRAATWIVVAWYLYGRDLELSIIGGGSRAEYISLLVHDSNEFIRSHQPQFYKNFPELGAMSMPDPPPELGGYRP